MDGRIRMVKYRRVTHEEADFAAFTYSKDEQKPEPHFYKFPNIDETEVIVDVLYFSMSYIDIASVKGHFGEVRYPFVPGNEAVGKVRAKGAKVMALKEGDIVGIGYFRKHCAKC